MEICSTDVVHSTQSFYFYWTHNQQLNATSMSCSYGHFIFHFHINLPSPHHRALVRYCSLKLDDVGMGDDVKVKYEVTLTTWHACGIKQADLTWCILMLHTCVHVTQRTLFLPLTAHVVSTPHGTCCFFPTQCVLFLPHSVCCFYLTWRPLFLPLVGAVPLVYQFKDTMLV